MGMDFQDSQARIWLNLSIIDEFIRHSESDAVVMNDRNCDSMVDQPK